LFAQINYPVTAINPTTNHSGGEYFVFQNATTTSSIPLSSIRKPIILIEGYDPLNDNSISNSYSVINAGGIGAQLHNDGYDIVVLNFYDGGDYIQQNALVLKQLVQDINSGKNNKGVRQNSLFRIFHVI
jgi:hypothetical protein